ncbi:MAG: hypothetical protein ACRDOJ_02985 [Nocardioidaceae bacterium]
MTLLVAAPGRTELQLEHLLLDVNGTLADRGQLLDGVEPRLRELRSVLDIHIISADTFGTIDEIAEQLGGLPVERISSGKDKSAFATRLDPATCSAIGNGANDEQMLTTVALGFAVLGREGAAPRTVAAADVVATSVLTILDLLLDPKALVATLRT